MRRVHGTAGALSQYRAPTAKEGCTDINEPFLEEFHAAIKQGQGHWSEECRPQARKGHVTHPRRTRMPGSSEAET